jgi:myo-inositol 2-dehydrogenase/D-chiro-inositol 1-dehydrogenase
MNQSNDPEATKPAAINRRQFVTTTGASLLGLSVLSPRLVGGTEANSKIDIGLIGCGNRGKWIADLFQKNGHYNLVALADYFQERVDEAGNQFQVPAGRRYTGLSAYRRLLEQKLDAVVIESPPYFHPEQAAATVEAGKHVYLAKPTAVDVPGCLTVAESAKRATAKKLCFLVDFQTRTHKLYQDAVRQVQTGALGPIVSVEAAYQCGPTWDRMEQMLRSDPHNPEARLRSWGVDRALSSDIITEQNIHALDVACWMLDAEPLSAYGTGGRTRESAGDCWDHFSVIYQFPKEVVVSFNSHQSGFGYDDILCRVFGLLGTADTHYFGKVTVKTTDQVNTGDVGNLYTTGAEANIAAFYENIRKGDCSNTTVPASVRSNLTTILGRMAAYQKTEVTWQKMLRTAEKFTPDLKGLKA